MALERSLDQNHAGDNHSAQARQALQSQSLEERAQESSAKKSTGDHRPESARKSEGETHFNGSEIYGTPPKETREWTVAYYLGATKSLPAPGKPENEDWGSPHKAEQLKQLAESTRGKGVTVLVDVLREKDEVREQRQKLIDDGKLSPDELASHNPNDYMVDHYRLKDGRAQLLDSTQSKGLTGDVSDLVRHASHDDPSRKVGLVMNVDGGGNRGVMSDSSPLATTEQLQTAIKQGLAGSGHERLDILDMDACLMGQTGSLATLSSVAKDLVASAETERSAVQRVDGQNLQSGLQHLLEHPQMSGKEWGEQIVQDAAKGANSIQPRDGNSASRVDTGTSTLANIDADRVKALSDATNKLGEALKAANADPSNHKTLEAIIEALPRYGADGSSTDSYGEEKRDLKTFTDELRKSISEGKISDPDGKLAAALSEVRSAQEAAVTAYSGDRAGGFDKDGGISVYLPDLTFRDVDKTLAQSTPLSQAAEVLKRFAGLPAPADGPEDVRNGSATAEGANIYARSYLQKLTDHQKEEAAPLLDALDQLKSATNLQERQAALQRASQAADRLLESPLQRELIGAADHQAAAKRQQEKLNREMAGELPGWRSFIESLDWHR